MLEFEAGQEDEFEQNTLSLLDAGANLFPGGTQVFPSRFHYPRRLWILGGAAGVWSVLCMAVVLVAGLASEARSNVTIGFVVVMVLVDAAALGLGAVWLRQDRASYEDKVANGMWLEGIFVFSTGDVVVRFNEVFRKVEKEFESGTISNARPVSAERLLLIEYVDPHAGHAQTYRVDCSRLVHDPAEIAQSINAREASPY